MGRTFRALVATALMVEIAAIFFAASTRVILSELHASHAVIPGAEGVNALAVFALAVVIFRRALEAGRRIEANMSPEA